VVRRRIYIIDMKEFRKVDEVWGKWFEEPYPVSKCVQVSGCLECFYVGSG
jgi:2-iminobutanoate/2-iminopropanoate deaminase